MLLLSITLAFLPSLLWLLLYLREDVHPEPNRQVLRVFIAGMLATIPTLAIEGALTCFIQGCSVPNAPTASPPLLSLSERGKMILSLFVAIALVEELMKFFAVRFTILHEEEFDEPIDAMLYLIIAALGFAAVENAFTVSGSQVQKQGFFGEGGVLLILGARSLSATLLHTLSSGIVGYALARTFFSQKPKRRILTLGLLIATLIHGTYNGIVGGIFVSRNAPSPFANVAILLIVTALALLLMLRHLRKLSAAHRWQNEGDHAQEVDLVVR